MPSTESEGQLHLPFEAEQALDEVVEFTEEPNESPVIDTAGRTAVSGFRGDYDRRVSDAAEDQGWGSVPDAVRSVRSSNRPRHTPHSGTRKQTEARMRAASEVARTQEQLQQQRANTQAYDQARSDPDADARVRAEIAAAREKLRR